ncbi:MAG: FkbM family methyltransferase [Thermoproteota archaeon]|jgi:FkbM family methyltransferase
MNTSSIYISYLNKLKFIKRDIKNYKLLILDILYNNTFTKNLFKNDLIKIKVDNFELFYHRKYISNIIAMISKEEYFNFIEKHRVYHNVVDIGAYAGLFSILMSNFSKNVFAIEANPLNYKILTMNISKNKLHNIIPINTYISDYNGFSYIYIKPQEPWSITLNASLTDTHFIRRKVEVKTLDKLAEEFNLTKIDLVKIDVDGEEVSVINGSKKLLINGVINEMIIEVHKLKFLQILINLLAKYGYQYSLKRSSFSKDLLYMHAIKRSKNRL